MKYPSSSHVQPVFIFLQLIPVIPAIGTGGGRCFSHDYGSTSGSDSLNSGRSCVSVGVRVGGRCGAGYWARKIWFRGCSRVRGGGGVVPAIGSRIGRSTIVVLWSDVDGTATKNNRYEVYTDDVVLLSTTKYLLLK